MKLQPKRRSIWTSAGRLLQCYKRHVYACLVGSLCDPVGCSPPGSSVHGIFQARILEWAAISISRGSSRPRDGTRVSCVCCVGRQILYHCTTLGSPWQAGTESCSETKRMCVEDQTLVPKLGSWWFSQGEIREDNLISKEHPEGSFRRKWA